MTIILGHWEYWNTYVVYFPVVFYLIWLGVKSRAFFFFNAANPKIQNGGFLLVSKWDMYQKAEKDLFIDTVFCKPGENETELQKKATPLGYPLIAKPDVGVKGRGVAIIRDQQELNEYNRNIEVNYLLQKKIEFPNEVGIFYVRQPGEETGNITGIVAKEFITVTGNGNSTIWELLNASPRYFLQLEVLEKLVDAETLNTVLKKGENKVLLSIGNHARGARFVDLSSKISDQLIQTIDAVCKKYPEYYYGRLDILYDTWEKLEQGKDFRVIEMNGAHSEPTHIYDPSHSIFFAWKEITRHWKYMYQISGANHKKGVPYLKLKEGIRLVREFKRVNRE